MRASLTSSILTAYPGSSKLTINLCMAVADSVFSRLINELADIKENQPDVNRKTLGRAELSLNELLSRKCLNLQTTNVLRWLRSWKHSNLLCKV